MIQQAVDVVDDLAWIVVWNLAGPTGADAFGPVHQHHGDDGNVPLWLHLLVVIVKELQQAGVDGWKEQLGQRTVKRKLKQNKHICHTIDKYRSTKTGP